MAEPLSQDPEAGSGSPSAAERGSGSAEGAHQGQEGPSRSRSPRRGSRQLLEWIVIVAAALVAALLVKTFLLQPFFIPSGSMEPTLVPGDRVLVNKLAYDFHPVHVGDVVVFKAPPTDTNPAIQDLIKRVIGLPGQTIQSGPRGEILINGKPIAQPWLTPQAEADPGPAIPKQVVPPGDFYVLGDNRGNSEDSRYIGPIPGRLIVGRAFVIVWPLSHLGLL